MASCRAGSCRAFAGGRASPAVRLKRSRRFAGRLANARPVGRRSIRQRRPGPVVAAGPGAAHGLVSVLMIAASADPRRWMMSGSIDSGAVGGQPCGIVDLIRIRSRGARALRKSGAAPRRREHRASRFLPRRPARRGFLGGEGARPEEDRQVERGIEAPGEGAHRLNAVPRRRPCRAASRAPAARRALAHDARGCSRSCASAYAGS
jgi:hypothetical protein